MTPRSRAAQARATLVAALAVLGVAFVLAVGSGGASAGFLSELDVADTALAEAAPKILPAPTPRRARRVVLVIIDGLRARDAHELPALDGLRRAGTSATAASHYPTWSRPNYVSILTGVPPEASGVRTNQYATGVALDSLMDRTQGAGLSCALASDYEALPRMFLRRAGDGSHRSPCEIARYAPWAGGTDEAVAAIATGGAALAVLLVGSVDLAGHLHGAASPAYRAAAHEADAALSQVLAGVDLRQDAVIVTADHGHIDQGGHGGTEPDVIEVPLVAAGAGIRRGARVDAARLIDIAPTIAALLGVPAPGHGLGRTLVELLALSAAEARAITGADRARLAVTGGIVDAADERAATALTTRRALRAAGAIALAVLVVAGGAALVRRRALRFDHRALAIALLTATAAYAAAYLLGASSVSSLPSRSQLLPILPVAGTLALVTHLGACAWAVRSHRDPIEQLATAIAIAAIALGLALIPAGVIWVAYAPPHHVLPGAGWVANIPVVFGGVACTAVVAAVGLIGSLFALLAHAHSGLEPRSVGAMAAASQSDDGAATAVQHGARPAHTRMAVG